jgi:hypothetical protein
MTLNCNPHVLSKKVLSEIFLKIAHPYKHFTLFTMVTPSFVEGSNVEWSVYKDHPDPKERK